MPWSDCGSFYARFTERKTNFQVLTSSLAAILDAQAAGTYTRTHSPFSVIMIGDHTYARRTLHMPDIRGTFPIPIRVRPNSVQYVCPAPAAAVLRALGGRTRQMRAEHSKATTNVVQVKAMIHTSRAEKWPTIESSRDERRHIPRVAKKRNAPILTFCPCSDRMHSPLPSNRPFLLA